MMQYPITDHYTIDSLNAYPTAVIESVSLDSTADDTAAILDNEYVRAVKGKHFVRHI